MLIGSIIPELLNASPAVYDDWMKLREQIRTERNAFMKKHNIKKSSWELFWHPDDDGSAEKSGAVCGPESLKQETNGEVKSSCSNRMVSLDSDRDSECLARMKLLPADEEEPAETEPLLREPGSVLKDPGTATGLHQRK